MTLHPEVAAVLAEVRERAKGWKHGAHPSITIEYTLKWADRIESALASSAEPVAWRSRIVSLARGVEYDDILRVHTPTVTLRFQSIDSANTDQQAQGWVDRDYVADLIAHAPPAVPVESLGRDAPDLAQWSRDMAEKEASQYVGAGAHGLDDKPAPPPASVPDGQVTTTHECTCGYRWSGIINVGSDLNCPRCNPTTPEPKP